MKFLNDNDIFTPSLCSVVMITLEEKLDTINNLVQSKLCQKCTFLPENRQGNSYKGKVDTLCQEITLSEPLEVMEGSFTRLLNRGLDISSIFYNPIKDDFHLVKQHVDKIESFTISVSNLASWSGFDSCSTKASIE